MRKIVTCLLFNNNDARQAAEFYVATFPGGAVKQRQKSPADYPGGMAGDELTVEFTVLGQNYLGINSGPPVTPNPAVSFQILTDDQAETDRYWNAIIAAGGVESQCGWCADRWGFSWQITPRALLAALSSPNRDAAKRAMQAMMTMRKIDIAAITAAFDGAP